MERNSECLTIGESLDNRKEKIEGDNLAQLDKQRRREEAEATKKPEVHVKCTHNVARESYRKRKRKEREHIRVIKEDKRRLGEERAIKSAKRQTELDADE